MASLVAQYNAFKIFGKMASRDVQFRSHTYTAQRYLRCSDQGEKGDNINRRTAINLATEGTQKSRSQDRISCE